MPSPSLLQRLKERKLVQWALAYLAGAFVTFQLLDALAEPLGLTIKSQQAILAVVVVGFFLTLVLAWYHGEKGRQRVSGPELLILAALLLVGGALLRVVAPGNEETVSEVSPDPDQEPPLVIIMDSPHETRVYDEEILAANGTNADVISDILLDLPIRRQKEAIGPEWHRDQEILTFDPELIIIHFSGFRQDLSRDATRDRFKLFVQFFADRDTQFLIYSRRTDANLQEALNELLGEMDRDHPGLLQRVRAFGVDDHGPRSWLDPTTAAHLKLAVKEILDLE